MKVGSQIKDLSKVYQFTKIYYKKNKSKDDKNRKNEKWLSFEDQNVPAISPFDEIRIIIVLDKIFLNE